MKGYMTLEAAFIVPWVFFIIVWLMYVAYFEYDRALLFQDNYILATQTAGRIDTVENKQSWFEQNKMHRIGAKYMGTKKVIIEGDVSWNKIRVSSRTSVNHPLNYTANMIPRSNWNISDTVEADNFSFVQRIRTFRSIGRILGE